VIVSALCLVLVVIYGGLVSWVGSRTELFYFNTLVASFVILSLFEPMREKVEEWVVVTLFRERYELVRDLEALRERIATVIDPARLATVLLDGLAETRRVTHASLWLLAEDRPGYRLMDCRGPPPAAFLEPAVARALLGAAGSGQKAIMLENIDRRIAELQALLPPGPADDDRRGTLAAVADEMKRLYDARAAMVVMRAGIAMPLAAGDRGWRRWARWRQAWRTRSATPSRPSRAPSSSCCRPAPRALPAHPAPRTAATVRASSWASSPTR